MKQLGAIILALTLGFLFTLGALLLLTAIIGSAVAQDAVPTYPARLGEQDRSFNYKGEPHYQSHEHEQEYFAYIVEAEASQAANTILACAQHNLYLRYMLVDVAKQIAKNPKLGYIYKDAIQTIHNSWCR